MRAGIGGVSQHELQARLRLHSYASLRATQLRFGDFCRERCERVGSNHQSGYYGPDFAVQVIRGGHRQGVDRSMVKRSRRSAYSTDQMTFSWMEPDPSSMPIAAKMFVQNVRSDQTTRTHFLISCGKNKQPVRAPAAQLYTSPRFHLSVALPRRLGFPFSVLSAKHGLLEPDTLVEPYDASLASLSREERRVWAENVFTQLVTAHPNVRRFVFLADDDYRDDIVPMLQERKVDILEPLLTFERSGRISFLRQANRFLDRESAIGSFYKCFDQLHQAGRMPTLREALRGELPNQGVYFFFDPNEPTRFAKRIPRLVRIGTHGVSKGSKATLRDRLRTHLGTADGYGNHRASVFRLHVGEAFIRQKDLRESFPEWGRGQNVERRIVEAEKELEKLVSAYISQLQLQCIEVADRATKYSARSKIERLSIALFTERLVPVEAPTANWLGLNSAHNTIARTGLWNLRDAGGRADFEIVEEISNRINRQQLRLHPDVAKVSS